MQHARPPCPSPTSEVYPKSCQLSWRYHPIISSSVIPFSSCPQSFPEGYSVMSNPLQPYELYSPWNSQAGILEQVAFPFSKWSSQSRDQTQISSIAGKFFTRWATRKPKNTGMGSLFLLQGLNWGVLHCRLILYQLSYQGRFGHRLGLLWHWIAFLGREERSFFHFWDCIQILHLYFLLTKRDTPFLLRDSCPQL